MGQIISFATPPPPPGQAEQSACPRRPETEAQGLLQGHPFVSAGAWTSRAPAQVGAGPPPRPGSAGPRGGEAARVAGWAWGPHKGRGAAAGGS